MHIERKETFTKVLRTKAAYTSPPRDGMSLVYCASPEAWEQRMEARN